MSDTFSLAFSLIVSAEGGYDTNPADRGNYTGGAIGVGELRGTKFGISAAAYPTLDIASLTLDDARAIYLRDYWTPMRCGELPPALAVLAFDAAVNDGRYAAAIFLQEVVGAMPDGIIGPKTMAAVAAAKLPNALIEFQARRTYSMALSSSWQTFGLGWSARLFTVFLRATEA